MNLVPRNPRYGPRELSFEAWQTRYAYLLWCIHRCLRMRTGDAHGTIVWDWDGIMHDLSVYAYRTSSNRYKSFVLLK